MLYNELLCGKVLLSRKTVKSNKTERELFFPGWHSIEFRRSFAITHSIVKVIVLEAFFHDFTWKIKKKNGSTIRSVDH